jgi:dephospho-CoA kinase
MHVIILSGKARSGKDTTADIIASSPDFAYRTAFGDHLKNIALILGWNGVKDKRGRKFLQQLGDVIRAYNPRYFIDKVIKDIQDRATFLPNDIVCITDCRYLNELQAIIDSFPNVTTIRIERNATSDLTDTQRAHQSETELDSYLNFDFLIQNNGTLNDLERKIKFILEEIR